MVFCRIMQLVWLLLALAMLWSGYIYKDDLYFRIAFYADLIIFAIYTAALIIIQELKR